MQGNESDGLRVGLQINTTQREFRWRELADLARAVEDNGLDSVWVEDHLFYSFRHGPVGPWEAWTTIGGLAAITDRIRIGSFVTPLTLRHPAILAKQVATAVEISDGRVVLGIGLGHVRAEFAAVGLDLEHRVDKFGEALQIIHELLDTGSSSFEGRYFQTRDFQLVPRPKHSPELMVGSTGPRTLSMALPHVDGWNLDDFSFAPDAFAEESAKVDAICREVGRDPAEVWRSDRVFVRLEGAEGMPFDPLPPDFPILDGGPSDLAAGLRAYADAGCDELQLLVDPPTTAAVEVLGAVVAQYRAAR